MPNAGTISGTYQVFSEDIIELNTEAGTKAPEARFVLSLFWLRFTSILQLLSLPSFKVEPVLNGFRGETATTQEIRQLSSYCYSKQDDA